MSDMELKGNIQIDVNKAIESLTKLQNKFNQIAKTVENLSKKGLDIGAITKNDASKTEKRNKLIKEEIDLLKQRHKLYLLNDGYSEKRANKLIELQEYNKSFQDSFNKAEIKQAQKMQNQQEKILQGGLRSRIKYYKQSLNTSGSSRFFNIQQNKQSPQIIDRLAGQDENYRMTMSAMRQYYQGIESGNNRATRAVRQLTQAEREQYRNRLSNAYQRQGVSPEDANWYARSTRLRTVDDVGGYETRIRRQNAVANNQALAGINRTLSQNEAAQRRITREIISQGNATRRLRNQQSGILDSLFNIRNMLIFMTASVLADFVGGLIDVTQRLQSIDVKFKTIAESASLGKDEMEWIKRRAIELKVPLLEAAEGYAQFYASAKDTLPTDQIRTIYDSLMQTSLVLHLSKDRFKYASLAFEQMISKGTVSMEELRRQLGEHVPGAFHLAAQAMGISDKALNDLVKSGGLASKELLLKLAPALIARFGKGVPDALGMAQAKITGFYNAIVLSQEKFSKSGFAESVGNIADSLKIIIESPKLMNAIIGLGSLAEIFSKMFSSNGLKIFANLFAFFISGLFLGKIKNIGTIVFAIARNFNIMYATIGLIASNLLPQILGKIPDILKLFRIIENMIEYIGITGWKGFWDVFDSLGDKSIKKVLDKLNFVKNFADSVMGGSTEKERSLNKFQALSKKIFETDKVLPELNNLAAKAGLSQKQWELEKYGKNWFGQTTYKIQIDLKGGDIKDKDHARTMGYTMADSLYKQMYHSNAQG